MQRLRALLIPLILMTALHGVIWVPFWSFLGLDFYNIYTFHHQCPGWGEAYLQGGALCGDPLNRAMVYPPVLYWMMSWVRLFDFKTALGILWLVDFISITGAVLFFVKMSEKLKIVRANRNQWLISSLLLGSLPMVYEFERGNNNGWVLGIWISASYFIFKKRFLWAGFFSAFAVAFKLYPVIPFMLIMGVLVQKKKWADLRLWILGAALFSVPTLLIFWKDHWHFITHSLPEFALNGGGVSYTSHTLYRGWGGLFIKITGLVLWMRWVLKSWDFDLPFVLSAILAISTFFPNTSNDYNLVTSFPFLFLLIIKNWPKAVSPTHLGLAALTLFAFIGDRSFWAFLGMSRGNTYVQVLWFFAFPIFYLIHPGRQDAVE